MKQARWIVRVLDVAQLLFGLLAIYLATSDDWIGAVLAAVLMGLCWFFLGFFRALEKEEL